MFKKIKDTCIKCGDVVDGRYRQGNKFYCLAHYLELNDKYIDDRKERERKENLKFLNLEKL